MFKNHARSAAGWLIAVAAIPAGLGLTYLLRHSSVLAFGPHVTGALPLQQLAGGESQPLGRMAVAWLCAGASAGIALATLTRSRLVPRTIALAIIAAALLLLSGAISDAVAVSDPVGSHLVPQLSRAGAWVADALLITGSVAVGLALGGRQTRIPAGRKASADMSGSPSPTPKQGVPELS